jgi:NitT/TauT family transport system substrate-binding protein
MSRRKLAFLAIALSLGLFSANTASAQTKVTAGVAAYNEALLPVFTAKEKGYFDAEGIALELVDFKGGAPAVQALASGSIDICFCAADHVIRLRARRQPAVVLVGLDTFHSYALVTKADAPYKSLADLKGQRIGISAPGSLTDNTIRYSIKELGLNADRDFELSGVGGGASLQAAIDSGRVAGALAILTDIVNMTRKPGAYKVVLDYRTLPYPSYAAIALQSYVKEKPQAARGFTKAIGRAIADLEKDPKLAETVIAKMYPNFSPELVAEVAKSSVSRAPKGGFVTAESIANLNKIVLSTDDTLQAVTLEQVFDPSLLKN